MYHLKMKKNKRKTKKNKNNKIKGGNSLIEYIKKKDELNAIKTIRENNSEIFKYDNYNRDPLFYAEKYNLINVINEINKAKKKIEDEKYFYTINKLKGKSYLINNEGRKTRKQITIDTNPEIENDETYNKDSYEPFLNDFINSNLWLKLDDDNIIIIYDSKKLCLKRSYFNNIISDNIILKCIIKNNTLIFKVTIKQKQYISLKSYGYNDNIVIDEKKLVNKIKKNKIINLINTSKNLFGTNKSFIINNPMSYDDYVKQYGISYNYQNSLAFYTNKWDNVINGYLRQGESFFDTSSYFIDNIAIFGNNKTEAINNIKNKISLIDKAFYDAPLTQSNIVLYRGVKHKIDDPLYDGLQLSYLSTTDNFNTAIGFTSYDDNCCIYKFILDIGIPYIFLDFISQTQGENEFLLPRNLILQFKNQYEKDGENIFEFFVKLDNKERYKNIYLCNEYIITDITT
jgi:hypothetical protein